MKKHISLVFTLALLMAVSFGCKVGADDPGFTFSSRDGRLIGEWKLTDVVDSTINVNVFGTFVTSSTYNGTILTTTDAFGSNTVSYNLEVGVAKNGILTVEETEDGDVTTETNYWEWLGNDQKKSQVLLNTGSMAAGIWDILRLSSKELVLMRHSKEVNVSGGSTESREETMKLTFEAL